LGEQGIHFVEQGIHLTKQRFLQFCLVDLTAYAPALFSHKTRRPAPVSLNLASLARRQIFSIQEIIYFIS